MKFDKLIEAYLEEKVITKSFKPKQIDKISSWVKKMNKGQNKVFWVPNSRTSDTDDVEIFVAKNEKEVVDYMHPYDVEDEVEPFDINDIM